MTQATPTIGASQSGLQYRNADNDGKKALLNHHKGSSAPSYAEAGIIWLDDTATPWLLKTYDGTDWIVLGEINAANNTFNPYHGAAMLRVLNHATDTGTANAYAVAPNPAITAYAAGHTITLKPANAQAAACTINVNGLGTKNIKTLAGADPSSGMMVTTGIYTLVYDGTNFVLLNPSLGSAAYLTAGTAANNLVQLNGSAQLPAVSGALLTNLPTGAQQLVLLATATASSSSSLNFTSVMTSAYSQYHFVIEGLLTSVDATIGVKLSTNNGSTWVATVDYKKYYIVTGNTTADTLTGGSTPGMITHSVGASSTWSGRGTFTDPVSKPTWESLCSNCNGSMDRTVFLSYDTAINAIQFLPSAGNFTSGKIYMYGVKNI